jgi:hypothetical protein
MTTEEIIAVAEGVGLHYYVNEMAGSYVERLERFAAVVASIEREACCQIVYGYCGSDNVAARTVEAIKARGT